MTAKWFDGVQGQIGEVKSEMKKGFECVDKRLDRIENLILRDHIQRIERLEDTVLQLKVKVGMR